MSDAEQHRSVRLTEGAHRTILFATMEFHPTNPGGTGTLIHHTVCRLLEQDYEIVLLFDGGRAECEKLVNMDRLSIRFGHRLSIYLLDDLCLDMGVLPALVNGDIAIVKSLRLDHALRKLTAIHDIDLIELYDYCGHGFHYLSRPAEERPPVAVRLHSTIELMERKTRAALVPERLWLYALERAQLTLADVILAPGKRFFEEDVQPLYPSLSPRKVLISPPVHRPIGQIEYNPEAANVAFYGRLTTLKGLDTFLRAGVMALKDSDFSRWLDQFIIIGPEDHVASALSLDELRALIPEEEIDRFHFTGRLTHTALMERLQSVSFACFANRVESFCYAAHEVHTAGMPLVVNRIAAFEDGFEDGLDAIFFDGTAFDLSNRMKQLARDTALRLRLSRRGAVRASSYWADHYTDQLLSLHVRNPNSVIGRQLTGTVVILSTGDRAADELTLASLSSLPLQPIKLKLDRMGDLTFGGKRWYSSAIGSDTMPAAGMRMVGDVCLFVRSGDQITSEWVKQALQVLAQNQDVGVVGGWLLTKAGIKVMTYIYIPELGSSEEPGLRVLLRVESGQSVSEYLHGWSGQSERSYLLAHRAAGRALVEIPEVAVDTRQAVEFPKTTDIGRSIDFDHFSREFLLLSPGPDHDTAAQPQSLDESDPDVLDTTLMQSLVVVRHSSKIEGELWIIRIRRDDRFFDLEWSGVIQNGDWSKVQGPDAPAGAQMTRSGSVRFHSRGRSAIELLFGPFCGGCEIVYRGTVHFINLQHSNLRSRLVWLDKLDQVGSNSVWATPPIEGVLPTLRPEHDLRTKKLDLVGISPGLDSRIAGLLRNRAGCCVLTPEELNLVISPDLSRSTAYAELVVRDSGCRIVAIDAAIAGGTEIAEKLLRADDDIAVVALLGERPPIGVVGAMAVYSNLGPWLRLARRFNTRISVVSTNDVLIEAATRYGLRASTIAAALPTFGTPRYDDDESAAIEVIIAAGTATVTNIAHMVMAVAHAQKNGVKIGRLWMPAHDELAFRIAGTFTAAMQLEGYENFDTVFAGEPHRRIGLAVFPDDELPDCAYQLLREGALPIVGRVPTFADNGPLGQSLCVTYWEDALAIADAVETTAKNYHSLVAHYNSVQQRQDQIIEMELAKLISGALGGA